MTIVNDKLLEIFHNALASSYSVFVFVSRFC